MTKVLQEGYVSEIIQKLSDKIGNHQYADVGVTCCNCNEDFTIKLIRKSSTSIDIYGGVIAVVPDSSSTDSSEQKLLFKCDNCKDDTYFGRECEVYSRVVGYLRPVVSWNQGKQDEFKLRKVYNKPE